MYGQARRDGRFTDRENASYNSRLVAVFFGALVSVLILAILGGVIVYAAVRSSGGAPMAAGMQGMPGMTGAGTGLAGRAPDVNPVVHMTIAGSVLKGPDGKLHDAFSATNYAVHVGQPIRLIIDNTDSAPHSITAPAAGVNIIVKHGVHTYTLVVYKAGRFLWYCALPCDSDAKGWAMSKPGFMAGYITAT